MDKQEFKELLEKAIALWDEGTYSASLTILTRLEREFPENAEVIYAKARCLLSLTRFEEARSAGRRLALSLKDPRGEEIVEYAKTEQATLASRRAKTRPYRILLRTATRPLTLLIIALIILLLPLVLSLSKRGRSLTLEFPQQSIGTLYYQESFTRPPTWQRLGEAKGPITLPSKTILKLIILARPDAQQTYILDLSSLTQTNMRLIHEIHAPHVALTETNIQHIAELRTLRHLDLSHTGVTDDGISNLILMSALREFNLQDNPITNTAALWLAGISTLEKLDIRQTHINDTGIGHLTELTNLTELRLPHHLTNRGLRRLAQIPTLESLDLNRTTITGNGLAHLTQLPNMTHIDMSATRVGPQGFSHLAQLPDLQDLDASHTLINDAALESIAQIQSLYTLNLDGAIITDIGLQKLTGLQNLTHLSLNTHPNPPEMTQTAIELLNEFSNLQNLTLSTDTSQQLPIQTLNPNIALQIVEPSSNHPIINLPTDTSLGHLAFRTHSDPPGQWQQLGQAQGTFHLAQNTLLSLRTTPETNADWARLRVLGTQHLARIQFDQNTWDSGIALPILADFPNLNEIIIVGASIQPTHIQPLADLNQLTTLRLHNINLTQDTLEFIQTLQSLETLDLTGSTLPNNSTLNQQDMPHLHTLTLPSTAPKNQLTIKLPPQPFNAYLFTRPLNANPNTPWTTPRKTDTEITLQRDQAIRLLLYNATAQDLEILAQNDLQNITELALPGPATDADLIKQLSAFPNLQHLQLSATPVTDEALANLHTLTQLTSIGLANTPITDEAITHLTTHPTLAHIDLANTSITNDGLLALTENKNLQSLNLEGTDITPEIINQAQRSLPSTLLTFHKDLTTTDPTGLRPAIVLAISHSKPLGTLFIRNRNSNDPLDWKPLGRPIFDTPIPAQQDLKITLELKDLIDMIPLANTDPQAFHILEFPHSARIRPHMIEAISNWTALHTIIFDHTVVNYDALQSLTQMPSLTNLSFHNAALVSGALSPLRALTRLRHLDLSASTISPHDFQHIATLPNLRTLDLRNTRHLNDPALTYLQELPNIQELNLAQTRITDDGLDLLSSFEQLNTLHLYNTLTTQGRVESLRIQRPRATIYHEGLALSPNDLNRLAQSLLGTDTPITREQLTQLLNITTLEDLLPQSLTDLQFTLLGATIRATHTINATTFQTISTLVPPEQTPEDQLAALQQTALQYLAEYAQHITAADLSALTGVEQLRDLTDETRLQLQRWAITALAEYPDALTPQSIADIAGLQNVADITTQDQSKYRALVLEVMADSTTGITAQAFAGLLGTPTVAEASPEQVDEVTEMAFSAMANSDTGITSQSIAGVLGKSRFEDIDQAELPGIVDSGMSAMANSNTGITTKGMAQTVGAQSFQDLPEKDRDRLRRDALQEITKLNPEISRSQLAGVAGVKDLDELPADERATIEAMAFSASAMASSDTGVTTEAVSSTVWGDTLRTLSRDDRLAARSRAITELARAQVPFTTELINTVLEGEAIQFLDLSNTNVTDRDIAALNDYRALRVLDLSGNKDITDQTLSLLSQAEALQILFLPGTNITDDGLKHLNSAAGLHTLDLAQTTVTGTGVAALTSLPQLQTLSLNSTPITDQSIQAITELTTLQDLDITNTQITVQGIGQLIDEMPNCNIQQDQITQEEIEQDARETQAERRLRIILGLILTPATLIALIAYAIGRQIKKNPEKFLQYRKQFNMSRRINAERRKHFRENLKSDGKYYTLYTFKGSRALLGAFWKALPYLLGIVFALVLFRVLSSGFLRLLESISDMTNTP